MVIIDQLIQDEPQSTTSSTYDVNVTSQDCFIYVTFGVPATVNPSSVTFNGNAMQQIWSYQNAATTITYFGYVYKSPPVGTFPLTVTFASGEFMEINIFSLLGVDKTNNNYFFIKQTTSTGPATNTISLSNIIPGSLLIDYMGSGSSLGTPPTGLYEFFRDSSNPNALAAGIVSGNFVASWTGLDTNNNDQGIVIFPPAKPASIWNPNVDIRNPFDVLQANDLDSFDFAGTQPANLRKFGRFPQQFFMNSFLHTVGRMPPLNLVPLPEVERQTSQIIIDKVYQGQVAGNGIAAGVLNLQVNIPSQDAVLVVTGGSVIATGTNWASVQLNGDNLIQLVQASVVGADAEIWVMWNPPVGVYTLTITGGNTTAEVYANAMVLLGVDKTNTNVVVASATDAASTDTITVNIAPDAANSLIIDTIATLDATANPVPNQSQNQVFNATAINNAECVISTYKLSTATQDNMNYNLSAAVNAALVAVAFRPARAISMWFPSVTIKTLDDVVDANGLDAGANPAFGSYGYQPSAFFQNSFLHTIGKLPLPLTPYFNLKDQLIAYYPFDENQGSTIYDVSGNLNHLQMLGDLTSSWESDGKINSAGKFNNINNNNVAFANIITPFNSTQISFGGWFWIDSQQRAGNFPHFINLGGGDNAAIYYNPGSGVIAYKFSSINGVLIDLTFVPQNPLLFNQWIHLIVVFTGNQIRGYYNGQQIASTNVGGNISFGGNNSVSIGAQDGGPNNSLLGKADEVGIWNRALSSFEISTLYNLGKGLSFPFLPNNNQLGLGNQNTFGYNPYAQGQNAYAQQEFQTSFLQTVGRMGNFVTPVGGSKPKSPLMMMSVGN